MEVEEEGGRGAGMVRVVVVEEGRPRPRRFLVGEVVGGGLVEPRAGPGGSAVMLNCTFGWM